MILMICLILFLLWIILFAVGQTFGGFVHTLIVVVLILVIVEFAKGKRL